MPVTMGFGDEAVDQQPDRRGDLLAQQGAEVDADETEDGGVGDHARASAWQAVAEQVEGDVPGGQPGQGDGRHHSEVGAGNHHDRGGVGGMLLMLVLTVVQTRGALASKPRRRIALMSRYR